MSKSRQLSDAINSVDISESAPADAVTLDASGNLLVGKTSVNSSVQGVELRAGIGFYAFTRDTTDSAQGVLLLNKKNNDGNIQFFQKDGSTVGSIGTANTTTYIDGSGNFAGLQFGGDGATEGRLLPRRAGAFADGEVDLGDSDKRFKDLYLSGGVYLGGTGAANKLDDYEEGTFTPTLSRFTGGNISATYSSQTGYYTKIGNLVNISIRVVVSAISSQGSGYNELRGLPFNPSGTSYIDCGVVWSNDAFSTSTITKAMVHTTDDRIYFTYDQRGAGGAILVAENWQAGEVTFSLTYTTTE